MHNKWYHWKREVEGPVPMILERDSKQPIIKGKLNQNANLSHWFKVQAPLGAWKSESTCI